MAHVVDSDSASALVDDDPSLITAHRVFETVRAGNREHTNGRQQIIAKDEWRQVIPRSPDKLDAVAMAVAGRGVASFASAGEVAGPAAF